MVVVMVMGEDEVVVMVRARVVMLLLWCARVRMDMFSRGRGNRG